MANIRFPTDTTAVTPALDDLMLISDTSDSGEIKEISVQNIVDLVEASSGVSSVTGTMVDNTDPANPVVLSDSTKVSITGDTMTGELVIDDDSKGEIQVRNNLLELHGTGVDYGCILSLIDSTQFAISAGNIEFVDRTTTPITYFDLTYLGGTYTNTYVASSEITYVYINSSGTVVQRTTTPTTQLTNEEALIGIIANSGGSQIAISQRQFNTSSVGVLIQEMARVMGCINVRGAITISPNGSNLNITRSAGNLFRLGVNADNSQLYPNTRAISLGNPVSFSHIRRDGSGGYSFSSLTTTLDVGNYDNGGVSLASSGNNWQIFRVYQPGNDNMIVAYGQHIYNTFLTAKASLNTETFVGSDITSDQCFIGYIITKGTTTDLSDTSNTVFINGISNGGGGSGSGDMTASIYDPAGVSEQLTGLTATQTITNKTISGSTNTLSNIAQSSVTNLTTDLGNKAPLASPTFTGTATFDTIKITGGTPGVGKVLTSDADGDATWETPSAGGGSAPIKLFSTPGTAYYGLVYEVPAFTGTITKLMISLKTLPVGGNFEVYIVKNGTSMLSGNLTITTTETVSNNLYTVKTGDSGKATFSTTAVSDEDTIQVYVVAGSGNTFLGAGVTISAIMSAS